MTMTVSLFQALCSKTMTPEQQSALKATFKANVLSEFTIGSFSFKFSHAKLATNEVYFKVRDNGTGDCGETTFKINLSDPRLPVTQVIKKIELKRAAAATGALFVQLSGEAKPEGADQQRIYKEAAEFAFMTSWSREDFEKLTEYSKQVIAGLLLQATTDPMMQAAILDHGFETMLSVLALKEYLTHYRNQVLINAGVTAKNTAVMGGGQGSTNCSYLPKQPDEELGGKWVGECLKKGFNLEKSTKALTAKLKRDMAAPREMVDKEFVSIEGIVANTMMKDEMLTALGITQDQKKLWETAEILHPMSQIINVMEAHVAKCDKEADKLIAKTLQNPEARQALFKQEDLEGKSKEGEAPTFVLTPAHHAKLRKHIEGLKKGMEKEQESIAAIKKSWDFMGDASLLEEHIDATHPNTAQYNKIFKDAAKAYEMLDKADLWAVGLANFKAYKDLYGDNVQCFTVKEPLTLCENGVKTKEQFKSNPSTGLAIVYRNALEASYVNCMVCDSIGMHNMICLNEVFAKVEAAA